MRVRKLESDNCVECSGKCLKLFAEVVSSSLWSHFSSGIMMKFKHCYNKNKCTKKFFEYSKYYSVTEMLLALGLSSFDTVTHTIRYTTRDAILPCDRKPTRVRLIYRTEQTTKKCKTEKLKSKNGYAQK